MMQIVFLKIYDGYKPGDSRPIERTLAARLIENGTATTFLDWQKRQRVVNTVKSAAPVEKVETAAIKPVSGRVKDEIPTTKEETIVKSKARK